MADLANLTVKFEQQLAQKEFDAAARTLAQIGAITDDLAQINILTAKLQQFRGDTESAEALYRDLLKTESSQKLLNQARQGLQEILDAERGSQDRRMAEAKAKPGGDGLGFLMLQPLPTTWDKKKAAAKIARIFRTDPATANTWIPMRQPKILRLGIIGELQIFTEQLTELGILAFWFSLEDVAKMNVSHVIYFELISITEVKAVCSDRTEIVFSLDQVKKRINGEIPIFSKVATLDAKFQASSKEQILDYIRICDLHLDLDQDLDCDYELENNTHILRFHDNRYEFNQGVQISVPRSLPHIAPTLQESWAALINWWDKIVPEKGSTQDFVSFAESMLAYDDLLKESVNGKIEFTASSNGSDRIKTNQFKTNEWDKCFHLFSVIHDYQ
jgi:hypothetical protein